MDSLKESNKTPSLVREKHWLMVTVKSVRKRERERVVVMVVKFMVLENTECGFGTWFEERRERERRGKERTGI